MSIKQSAAALVLGAAIISPVSAWSFTGVGGCSGLPEYYRALGALQGNMESACDMTVDQARHILAGYGGVPGMQQAPPGPRKASHRRHAPVQR